MYTHFLPKNVSLSLLLQCILYSPEEMITELQLVSPGRTCSDYSNSEIGAFQVVVD